MNEEEEVRVTHCPICGGIAEPGTLYGQSNCLKWLPWSRSLFIGQWAVGGTTVGRSGFRFASGRSQTKAIFCTNCKRLIIDSDQIGVERLHYSIQSVLILFAAIAGGLSALVTIQHVVDTVAGVVFGFPLGAVLGWLLGIGILRSFERLFKPSDHTAEMRQ